MTDAMRGAAAVALQKACISSVAILASLLTYLAYRGGPRRWLIEIREMIAGKDHQLTAELFG